MGVSVTTSSGVTQLAGGADWGIDQGGYLTVVDDSGSSVASFAPGAWASVEQVAAS